MKSDWWCCYLVFYLSYFKLSVFVVINLVKLMQFGCNVLLLFDGGYILMRMCGRKLYWWLRHDYNLDDVTLGVILVRNSWCYMGCGLLKDILIFISWYIILSNFFHYIMLWWFLLLDFHMCFCYSYCMSMLEQRF